MSTISTPVEPIAPAPGEGEEPAARLEISPAPTAPPDVAAMAQLAAQYGMEILGPPGIPA
jgi:hypothetical protein